LKRPRDRRAHLAAVARESERALRDLIRRWQALPPILPEHFDPDSRVDQGDYWFVEEYVQALDEGRDHECSGGAARHVIEIMMGIFESAAYGVRVELPQKRREHPLLRFRAEAGLGVPEEKPRPYGEWLNVEDRRLGRIPEER